MLTVEVPDEYPDDIRVEQERVQQLLARRGLRHRGHRGGGRGVRNSEHVVAREQARLQSAGPIPARGDCLHTRESNRAGVSRVTDKRRCPMMLGAYGFGMKARLRMTRYYHVEKRQWSARDEEPHDHDRQRRRASRPAADQLVPLPHLLAHRRRHVLRRLSTSTSPAACSPRRCRPGSRRWPRTSSSSRFTLSA